ncbi:dipeptidase [Hymenobacter translucens]|uniref:dipeptidase n=1 Tax=Hymenobacter translucens TaxID=2886507 RepID=UPI001D0E2000|nr:dipeptidase [Hymenobacter translucens]
MPTTTPAAEARLQTRARLLHERAFTLDSHQDTPGNLLRPGFDLTHDHRPDEKAQVDLPKLRRGGLDAAFWAVYVGQGPRTAEGYAAIRQEVEAQFRVIEQALRHYPRELALATSPDQARRIRRAGPRAIFIGLENSYPVGLDLRWLETYYRRGARYVTLCHSSNNDICDSATDPTGPEHHGLSDFGREAIREMNRLGLMVDTSHTSDDTFYDCLAGSRVPIIASHSGCRALSDTPRNLSDAMLRDLAHAGGVVQVNLFSPYVKTEVKSAARQQAEAAFCAKWGLKTFLNVYALPAADRTPALAEYARLEVDFPVPLNTVADVADQIDHVVQQAGIDHVGIGSDFDGGSVLNGLADVGDFPSLTLELVRRGYRARDLNRIWSGNLFRVMRTVARGKVRPAR